MLNGVLDRLFGDFVELHAVYRLAIEQAFFLEYLVQMPGDGLAFAIRVSGQIQRLRTLHRLGDGVDMFFVFLDEIVFHLEIVFGIDRPLLGDQVAYMAIGSQGGEILAQVFRHGLRLGRRLNYD